MAASFVEHIFGCCGRKGVGGELQFMAVDLASRHLCGIFRGTVL